MNNLYISNSLKLLLKQLILLCTWLTTIYNNRDFTILPTSVVYNSLIQDELKQTEMQHSLFGSLDVQYCMAAYCDQPALWKFHPNVPIILSH